VAEAAKLPPGALDHAALAKHMGWSDARVARTLSSRSKRRREAGTSRPGDLPPPDGRAGRVSYWREATIEAWAATRPSVVQEARNLPDGLKVCSKCAETKPLSEYHVYTDNRRGGERRMHAKCKTCHMKAAQSWNERNRERAAAADARWKKKTKRRYKARLYGLTEVELMALEATQQGMCLICGELAEVLYVDHDHKTGAVRGLLCILCNTGLGAFHDDPKRLLRAIRYLRMSRRALFAEPDRESTG